MRQRRPAGVRVLAIVFVFLSLYSLRVLIQTVIYHFERRLPFIAVFREFFARTEGGAPPFPEIIFFFETVAILAILWAVFVYLVAAVGVMKLRPWVRYLALVLAVDAVATIVWNYWMLCSEMYPVFSGPVWFAILISAFLYLNRSDLKRLSSARVRSVDLAPRLLIGMTLFFIVLKLALVPAFFGCFKKFHFGGYWLSSMNLKAVKTEYRVTDRNYLEKHYQRQSIFGCSLRVPRDLRTLAARIDRSSSGLILLLEGKYGVGGTVRFTLWSNNAIVNTANRFGFRDPYEFEKIVHRPSWRAMDLWMKEAAINFVSEKIEDGKSPHWRGFVKINEESGLRIRSSLYDIKSENSLDIRIVFQHGPPALGHAKDVLAALEFETDVKNASVYLNEGKTSLSNGEYVDASFDFLNAHFVDRLNPEHAYYFARSLLEGPPEAVKWGRRDTAKEFLEYALELDSTYHEAEELLATVEKEIEDLRGR